MRLKTIALILVFILLLPSVVSADGENVSSFGIGKSMISGGIAQAVVDFANGVMKDTGFQAGVVSGNNVSGSQTAIFALAAYQIDVFSNPIVKTKITESVNIFKSLSVIFLLLITLFVLLQTLAPETAAQITTAINGRPTYYQPSDIVEYVAYICFWFLGGVGILWAELEVNNYVTQGMMLDVLNQVSLSADNITLYVVMAFCYVVLLYFVAIRIIIIFYAASVWYLLGLVLAVRKTRWLGVLAFLYVSVQIFMQAIIVSVTTFVVQLVASGSIWFIPQTLMYGSLTLFLLGICIIIETWPILLQILKPSSMKAILYFGRYVL
jgi:hypothetical protein